MQATTYKWTALVLIAAGLVFSGYLSAIKFFTSTCAFNEPCPYFLGYPACWYGFGMYAVMFIAVMLFVFNKTSLKSALRTNGIVSLVGIIFAGRFTVPEITGLMTGQGSNYSLGLPTCVYGLIFYILIFVITVIALRTSVLTKQQY